MKCLESMSHTNNHDGHWLTALFTWVLLQKEDFLLHFCFGIKNLLSSTREGGAHGVFLSH